MWIYFTKTILSALIIVVVTEVSKRSGLLGGLIKSLPLISLLSFIWLYTETKNTAKVAALSVGTFWFVLPSLPFFLVFPLLLRQEVGFWPSLGWSLLLMLACYGLMFFLMSKLDLNL